MAVYLLIFSIIIITCVFLNNISMKVGIPVLLFFLTLGLICGSQDNEFASQQGWFVGDISTIALIFIMFYGGFGTRWKSAKPIIVEASLLATFGVALTAVFVGLFCHWVLKWGWIESLLMGSVVSSTDAATVFSILRTRKLGLKNNTAPILEVESGSNDPMSYMLTAVMLSLLTGSVSTGHVIWEIFSQIVFGAGGGLVIATGSIYLLRHFHVTNNNGFELLLFIAIAIAAYCIPSLIGGNGYLSTYIVGIVLGNAQFPGRKQLVAVFDAITSLMQIIIFFLLGMLANPSNLYHSLIPSLIIFAVLTFVARPLSIWGILHPFKKYSANQLSLIAFSGLRGAASIVFAIMILTSNVTLSNDIFSIVFCIVLISIALQGSLIPAVAKKTNMIDTNSDVMTTFNDFKETTDITFGCVKISETGRWEGKYVKDLQLPKGFLLILVLKDDEQIIPTGDTLLQAGDSVVFCSPSYEDKTTDSLIQHRLSEKSKWAGHMVKEYPNAGHNLLVMIKRGEEKIIPDGNTVLQNGDVLVLLKRDIS